LLEIADARSEIEIREIERIYVRGRFAEEVGIRSKKCGMRMDVHETG
jgi:hypothetical protein